MENLISFLFVAVGFILTLPKLGDLNRFIGWALQFIGMTVLFISSVTKGNILFVIISALLSIGCLVFTVNLYQTLKKL